MNKLSIGLLSGIFAAVVVATPAFAWHFTMKGSGACQQDGSYKITWVIDNSTEKEDLKVTYSSNPAVIAVGAKVPAKKSVTLTQTVDGKKPANYKLTISGHWKSDKKDRTLTAKADLCEACAQPQPPVDNPPVDNPPVVTPPVVTPPVTGGMGSGDVTPAAVAVETPVPAAQVITPVGAVNAGQGGAPKSLNLASLAGLAGSVSAAVLGARRFKKQS